MSLTTLTLPPAVSAIYYGSTPINRIKLGQNIVATANTPDPDIAFPSSLFDIYGTAWDPYDPNQKQAITNTGSAPSVGDPVGYIPFLGNGIDYSGTSRTPNLAAPGIGQRPLLAELGGYRGWTFDGSDDRLIATWVENFHTGPRTITAFARLYGESGLANVPFCFARTEATSSHILPIAPNTLTGDGWAAFAEHKAGWFLGETQSAFGTFSPARWHTIFVEYALTSYASNGGHVKIWHDGTQVVDADCTPTKDGTSNVGIMTRVQLGARLSGSSSSLTYNGTVGRFGSISRSLASGERATLTRWLEGITYVP